MSIKEFLGQAFYLNKAIDANKAELEHLRVFSLSIGTPDLTNDRVQANAAHDFTGDTIAKIVDLENVIRAEIAEYVQIAADIRCVIMGVKDRRLKLILQKRYMNFERWGDIADDMDYNEHYIFELHREALCAAEKSLLNLTIDL